jgi:5-methyltetrahydrofolate--homocysteine methyltransferase
VLIFDGAMGTSIQRYPLTADDFGGERYNGCNDYLVITRPDVIEDIHASFLAVGCEVVETDTFRANRLTLGLCWGSRAGSTARRRDRARVADHSAQDTGIPRYVAGSIGASDKLPSSDDPELSNIV